MTMADTVAVMNAGRIEQLGAPAEIYEFPATAFVASFLGQSNLLAGEVTGRSGDDLLVEAYGSRFTVPAGRARAGQGAVHLGVRPEKLHLATGDEEVPGGHQRLDGVVSDSSYLGVSTQYLVRTAWGMELSVFVPNSQAGGQVPVGADVVVHWLPAHAFLLARLPGPGDGAGAMPAKQSIGATS